MQSLRVWWIVLACLLLTGCGVATAATHTSTAVVAAEQSETAEPQPATPKALISLVLFDEPE